MVLQPTRSQSGEDKNWRILTVVLGGLLGWRLLLLFLSPTELYFDEAQYWVWSQNPAMGYFSKPPVLAWIIGATTTACGSSSEFCVRMGSPLLHTGTAVFVSLIGKHLYDSRTGFWAAIIFATLPAISLSSHLISTDVPLLFFWAGALYCWVKLLETRSWISAIFLGLALGLGLMSKYAMIYFVLCAGLYLGS